MYFLTFEHNGNIKVGALNDEKTIIVPAEDVMDNPPTDMIEFIKRLQYKKYIDTFRAAFDVRNGININEVTVKAPIIMPVRNVICVGKNYRDHIKEVARAIDDKDFLPEHPVYFSKMVDKILGPDEAIPSQSYISDMLDYEVELAVIIGKEGKDIPKDKVEEHIFGYSILNDISVRDIQRMHLQWFRGKSLDGTCAMGPYIACRDMVSYPPKLDISCRINGELRQNSNTEQFIFDIDTLISDFSKGITLRPGDIIATGTPSGVGMGFTPGKFLKHGDVVECSIECIGTLRNVVD